jgi:hypothetical protein
MAAATISVNLEGRVVRFATHTGPASYTTGGEDVTAGQFGLSRIDFLYVSAVSEGGYGVAWDPSASKIKWTWVDTTTDGAPMAEVAAATDLDAEIVGVIAVGLP